MPKVQYCNVKSEPLLAPVGLRPRKRRLDRIVREYATGIRAPFLVSVHKPGEVLTCSNETIRLRQVPKAKMTRTEKRHAEGLLWRNTIVERNDIVLITILPAGGGRGGAGKIALTVAAIALMAFAGPIAGFLLKGTALAGNAFAVAALQAGITIGGGALLMAFARQNQDNRQVYGVSGGGNLPRPNDRIPVGYGEFWTQPDLTQPDYYRYESETNTVLFKRICIGLGDYELLSIRVGSTVFWNGELSANGGIITSGITTPFPGCKFELLNGTASTLVPSNVVTSASVTGQTIPLSTDVTPILGPFAVNPVGTEIIKIQVDYSTPSGYSRNNHETTQDLHFEYAPIDDAGSPTGAWQTLFRNQRAFFTTKALRWSNSVDVAAGRYAVRARNNRAKIDDGDNCNYSWDGLRGYSPDTIVRSGMTEIAMEVRGGEGLSVTSFSDVQVKVRRVGNVWDDEEQEFVTGPIRKCVDVFVDMLRDAEYGAAVTDSAIDLAKVAAYRSAVTEFDVFDGVIRGPLTVWDALGQVLSNMRAEPVRIGAGYSFVRDEPSALRRHVFSRSQIVRDTLTITERPKADDGEAHVIIEFSPDADPKRRETATAYYGPPSLTPRRIQWPGVSTYEHAMHLARWFAASGYYRRTTVSFETELSGRIPLRGQPIFVDPWFVEERQVSGVLSRSGNDLTIDSDIAVSAGDRAIIRDIRGREWGPVRVIQGEGLRNLVLNADDVDEVEDEIGIALADVIAPDNLLPTTVVVGPLADLGTVWLMASMEPGEGGRTSLSAKIDAAEVYAAINASIPPISPLTWALVPVEAPTVTNLRANVVQHTSSLVAQWSITSQVGAVRYEVQIAYADDEGEWETVYAGPAPVGDAPIRYLDTEEPVYIRARAFGATGLTGGWQTSDPIVAPKPDIIASEVEPGIIDFDALSAAVDEKLSSAFDTANDALSRANQAAQDAQDLIASLSGNQDRAEAAGQRIGVSISRRVASLAAAITDARSVIEDTRGALGDLGWERRGPGGASRFRAVDVINEGLTTLSTTVNLLAGRVDTIVLAQEGLGGLDEQFTLIRETLDAVQGLVETVATTANAATGSVTLLQNRMDIVEGQIALLVTTAQLDDLIERVEAAELILEAGTVTIETVSGIRRSIDRLGQGMGSLIARFQAMHDVAYEQMAGTKFRLDSRVNELGEAQADFELELTALTQSTAAGFLQSAQALATATQALVQRADTLEAALNSPTTGLAVTRAQLISFQSAQTTANGAFATDITGLQSALGTANTNIAANASAIGSLQTSVTSINGTLASYATQLTNLESSVSDLETDVAGNAAAIGTLQTNVTTINGTLTTYAGQITSLQTDLDALESTVAGQATAISTLQTTTSTLTTTVNGKNRVFRQSGTPTATSIGDLWIKTSEGDKLYYAGATGTGGWVVAEDQRIPSLVTTVASQASDITSLTASLTTANSNISANSSAISSLNASVTSINGTLTSVASQLAAIEASIAGLSASITEVRNVTIDPTGASALWSVQLDVDGRVSGLKNLNTGETSAFIIRADLFGIENPDTEELSLYYDTDTNTFVIKDGTLIAAKVTSVSGRMVSDYANEVAYWLDESDEVIIQIGDLDYEP